ncbi:MAG TPA: imidazole glycerol phosphate synthase subunit HisH [Candidatus Omnitrophica bacterium]|nr:MAG: imidazole glycerol phosphate synthase subunit HisH [Candidatus Omnitrophota bacterium]RKY34665.1 MAG: imidazole glycerol phosphate synthase subunit HisH [Candidatus Omnitrophota bacterium]RKY44370.1 MAG: imidazole glycerol phosphate synthase subunit HisH [Candidatus Omnitrophota bacterium]HEC69247.1 imidazole glycerol phosphate synthase subunit HisH [Candidatus Omnitrophota bacterium]
MEKVLGVIDYGLGNLRSVSKALEVLGVKVILSSDVRRLSEVRGLILPGVGAFKRGMENLEKLGLKDFLRQSLNRGIPFLGICLGFQLLFTESEEGGRVKGLEVLKGRVVRFSKGIKIPHMGWNQVEFKKDNNLFKEIPDKSFFYFVHSYYVEPEDKDIVISTTDYGGEFVSAINKDNLWAVQFHPEKSSELGLKLLKNFISIC